MESTNLNGGMNNLKTRNTSVARGKKSTINDANIDVSLQDMIDSVQKKALFGMSEYQAPNNDFFHIKPKNGKTNQTKKVTYIQEHMNKVKNLPSSAAYHKTEDWQKHHPPRAGKFQWKERKMISTDIMKKKPSPGPSNYKTDH